MRKSPHQARDLAQPDHLSPRQVPDVAAAEERQHVVFAEAVEGNVFDQHHLVVVLVEYGAGDNVGGIDRIAVGQLSQRTRHPSRRRLQALSRRVLAELAEQRLDQLRNLVSMG